MNNHKFFESNYKKLGFLVLNQDSIEEINGDYYKPYIKVLYLPKDYSVTIDFKQYKTTRPSLFFINSNQYLQIDKEGKSQGYFMYYNRDFYCVQIHDAEVACDGLLFNNIFEMPMTALPDKEVLFVESIYDQIQGEFDAPDSSQEEMIRTYLKQLIIKATRIWKIQQLGVLNDEPSKEMDFFRDFSRLVEIHFRTKHTVADYADILGVAPKTLSNKFNRLELTQPNDIIKDRIMLEAKRLLGYSALSVKEIAYQLGYEDPAYFNRLFTNKVGDTPSNFKKKYLLGKNVQSE
ncbi:helix-turn-helix domain-containing protein [Flavobacterium sp. ANB]|jgi:AraC family transcriptional regulator, transcriptional activator of pobA|uniref:AraC family transcriptional regulator n=1 Tax=unclassified Flavobacterium TaxID=196869 RepID=UPI0012B925A6|nr:MULTISPECIES: helix-turn-helix domain-containing protein [unclassified Flavobacterium]MBF4515651.1 helix-turn-helix domain-containing protein [Flavobacterium sp. ANB]MTD68654.1 helix-turn-helix domain-containing protein [Flavobacterium sp. LC2016-13]